MPTEAREGRCEVICGPMFSGKTEELLRRLRLAFEAKKRIQVFKPSIDRRYHESRVTSHAGNQWMGAYAVPGVPALASMVDPEVEVLGLDEAQFFGPELVKWVAGQVARGVRVIVAGLDLDYLGQPFEPIPGLLALADEVVKAQGSCSKCGAVSRRSFRTVGGADRVLVGAAESYTPLCVPCYQAQPPFDTVTP